MRAVNQRETKHFMQKLVKKPPCSPSVLRKLTKPQNYAAQYELAIRKKRAGIVRKREELEEWDRLDREKEAEK